MKEKFCGLLDFIIMYVGKAFAALLLQAWKKTLCTNIGTQKLMIQN